MTNNQSSNYLIVPRYVFETSDKSLIRTKGILIIESFVYTMKDLLNADMDGLLS